MSEQEEKDTRLPAKWRALSSRQRLLALMLAGTVLAAGLEYAGQPAPAAVPPAAPPPVKVQAAPEMPAGFNPGAKQRDPFQPPPGYDASPQAAAPPPAQLPAGAPAASGSAGATGKGTAAPAAVPALTGVAQAGGKRAALIRYGGKTQPYFAGEYIGSDGQYRVADVADDAATVTGPGGRLVLTLER